MVTFIAVFFVATGVLLALTWRSMHKPPEQGFRPWWSIGLLVWTVGSWGMSCLIGPAELDLPGLVSEWRMVFNLTLFANFVSSIIIYSMYARQQGRRK